MSNAPKILPAAIALVLGAGACTETTEPPEPLTEQEAMDLLEGYRTLLLDANRPQHHLRNGGRRLDRVSPRGQAEVSGSGEDEMAWATRPGSS